MRLSPYDFSIIGATAPKQKERLAVQEQKLEELTLKARDVEKLLDEVSGAAYDKAVETVANKVQERTRLADIAVIEKYRKSVTSPGTKNSPQVVKLTNTILNCVKEKLEESSSQAPGKVQAALQEPDIRQAGKEQVKAKARESIKGKLARAKEEADRKNRERREHVKTAIKQDMEL